jgi:hypothetical protein
MGHGQERVDLERALAELYGASPDDFIATRKRLAAELRQAGAPEAAVDLERRRRPTIAAWAVNQVARREPEAITELFAATTDVAVAQRATLDGSGDTVELRAATRRRQELLSALADAAVDVLTDQAPKPATHFDTIVSTFDAATFDPVAGRALIAGQLTQPLAPPVSFGAPAALPFPDTPPSRPRRPSARQVAKAERDVEVARRAADAAARAEEDARSNVASADLDAESALSHLREVDQARDRARDAVSVANSRLTDAQHGEIAAQAASGAARRLVAEREAALDALRRDHEAQE